MKFFLILLFIFSGIVASAQNHWSEHLLSRVNQLRDSLGLPLLQLDNTLNDAAYDQAFYISNRKRLTHTQKTFSKETVGDRVLYFGGNRTYVGENVASIQIKRNLQPKELADSLFYLWFHSPGHYANMVHPQFTFMGVGMKQEKSTYYSAQVFSSREIDYPKAFKAQNLSWGVRPNEHECARFSSNYNTMFFANSVSFLGREVYFLFHDMKFFNSIISKDNDGLAIDIVLREQLPCGRENQFHVSPIYDGEMQRPVYRNDLFKNDISENPKKIYVKIGEIPEHLVGQRYEVNVIVVVDNHNCDYCIPIEVPNAIYPLVFVEAYYEKDEPFGKKDFKLEYPLLIQDSIHLTLDYQRSDTVFSGYDAGSYERLLALKPYLKRLRIDCYASVEGDKQGNMKLLEQRKVVATEFLDLSEDAAGLVDWNLEENWSLMWQQVEEQGLSHLKAKSKSEIKDYFRKTKNKTNDDLLFEQRRTHIYAWIDSTIVVHDPSMLQTVLYYNPNFKLSELPWNQILRDQFILQPGRIPKRFVDTLVGLPEYRTNLLGALANNSHAIDSLQMDKHLSLKKFSSNQQLFNYAHFLTHYWFDHFAFSFSMRGVAPTIKPEKLLDLIKPLDKDLAIDSVQLSRLRLNIYLSGIHYYSAHSDWKPKNKYFDKIVEIVKSGNFTAQEAQGLALFFNRFYKFEGAIQILDPFFDSEQLDTDGYFILAKTATLMRKSMDEKRYFDYMMAAKKANHSRYCNWLNDSFQILRDENIKKDYCESCL
jgi:hypothetical protein